jgi:hypothetical protein
LLLLLAGVPLASQADAVAELQDGYLTQGVGQFSAANGESLWAREYADARSGQQRSCALCHTRNLTNTGKHAKTGKTIEPMAPSVNPQRLTDKAKIEKWFKRNCKWTLGRECTPQEKGDLLSFIRNQ